VEFRARIPGLDLANHRNRLAPVSRGFFRQSEDQRERARNSGFMTLTGDVVKHSRALEPDFVYRTQDVVGAGLGTNENAAQAGLSHQTQFVVARTEQEIRGCLNAPVKSSLGSQQPFCNMDSALALDQEIIVDDRDKL